MFEPTVTQHSLAIVGSLFSQSLQIRDLDNLEQWGLIIQDFIRIAESQQDPLLPSLLKLKESVYRSWIHPRWSDRCQAVGSREKC